MKKLRILPAVLLAAALLSTQALAAPTAELIRTFETGGALYTYVSLTGSNSPITKAEARLGRQSFPASGPLETVRQAGFPVEYLLLVDNSNSMPPFREEISAFTAALVEAGGEHTSYTLASFGSQFTLAEEHPEPEALADAAAAIPMDETVTRLNTSIDQALDHFESMPRTGNQLRCLVVLSDGVQYDPQGGVPYDQLVERLSRSDVMLHCVGLGEDGAALERLGGLALASGGTHWTASGPQEAAQAAKGLAQWGGDLLVTSFDISAYRPAGGEEPVSVTFASGGTLVCRGEGSVLLSPAGESEVPPSEAPAETPGQTPPPATEKPADPPPEGQQAQPAGLPAAAIIGGAAVLVLVAVLLVLVLRRKKPAAPEAPESPAQPPAAAALSSVYLRLAVPEDVSVRGNLEWELSGSITLGSDPACDVTLTGPEAGSWQLRLFLHEGAIWCAPVSGPIAVNDSALQAEQKLRSGDTVSCCGVTFQLKF